MIKTVVLDMDGTLIGNDGKISARTRDVLIKAQKRGLRIILASGRTIHRMIPFAKELKMDEYDGYLVYVNGTGIYEMKTDKNERLHELSIRDQVELFNYFKHRDIELISMRDTEIFAYVPRRIYLEKINEATKLGLSETTPLVSDGHQSIGKLKDMHYRHINMVVDEDSYILPTNKMAVFGSEDKVIEVAKEASEHFEGKYWIGRTMKYWVEIMPYGVNKAETLKRLFEEKGIRAQEAIAFGDGENDIEMLELCAIGVAMKNSLESLKRRADHICGYNHEDGIAIFLEDLLEKSINEYTK